MEDLGEKKPASATAVKWQSYYIILDMATAVKWQSYYIILDIATDNWAPINVGESYGCV